MKKLIKNLSITALSLVVLVACGDDSSSGGSGGGSTGSTDAEEIMTALWKLSPLDEDQTTRQTILNRIQTYADLCSASTFEWYVDAADASASAIVSTYPVLDCYDLAFDKVLSELKTTTASTGSVVVWNLYNMGYIVKTPSATFAIDICHRRGAELEPYLDFMGVTHNHTDHYNTELMSAMYLKGKPVISNYYEPTPGYQYCYTTSKSVTIGGIDINTFLVDHNTTLTNFVTVFEINCGDDTDDFIFVHVGDSNYTASQFELDYSYPDLFVGRYAPNALTEGNVVGKIVYPSQFALSHILELTHADVSDSRWSIDLGFLRVSDLAYPYSSLPFWGDKMVMQGSKQGSSSSAQAVMEYVWNLSPFEEDQTLRQTVLNTVQESADLCSDDTFDSYVDTYLGSDANTANSLTAEHLVLECYNLAFSKVVAELQSTEVEQGSIAIWSLYNMGYIFKTPTACFGIDLNHRRASELVYFLDFMAITHYHSDHYNKELMSAMYSYGKPVISNYYQPVSGYQYCSTEDETVYSFGDIKIKTFTTNHNNTLTDFVTVYEIYCGDDTNGFVLVHVGDSNYTASQYYLDYTYPDLLVGRYAPNALTEINVVGAIVKPQYFALSHILELAHADISTSRWSIDYAYTRADNLGYPNTIIPFWGDMFIMNGTQTN